MRARTSVVAVLVAALFVGVPAVAYAATAEYRFDATKLGNQRLPDFNSPNVSSGSVTSDMDGTACDSTYDYQLVRHRSYLPDEVVHRNTEGRACDGEIVRSGLSWSQGFYHLDVPLDTVALAGWLKGLRRRELGPAARAALAEVGLADRANERARVLSGGMRRRLCFATAVVHRPALVLLDEPTVGLDPEQRAELCRLVAALAADRIVLMSTHVLDDVRGVAGSVAVMTGGVVPYVGSAEQLVRAAGERLGRALDPARVGDLDLAYLALVGEGAAAG